MKKYRLTDNTTLLGALKRLLNTPVTSIDGDRKYFLQEPEQKLAKADVPVVALEPLDNKEIGNPESLFAILKENRVELRVKLLNPYQKDLFTVTEIVIEPLGRARKRFPLQNVKAHSVHIASTVDIATILSLYGKTSLISQTLDAFEDQMEISLNNAGYFVKSCKVGFFYSADSLLMEELSRVQAPFFLRDSNKQIIYEERTFFNPVGKLSREYWNSLLNDWIVQNKRSVLVFPFFTSSKALLGYVEIMSSLPDIGNSAFSEHIEEEDHFPSLLKFLELRSEDLTFQMELSYVKDWLEISSAGRLADLSEDGRGVGLEFSENLKVFSSEKIIGSKISFSLSINGYSYRFFGNIRNCDPKSKHIGMRVHASDPADGLELLAIYATRLLPSNAN